MSTSNPGEDVATPLPSGEHEAVRDAANKALAAILARVPKDQREGLGIASAAPITFLEYQAIRAEIKRLRAEIQQLQRAKVNP